MNLTTTDRLAALRATVSSASDGHGRFSAWIPKTGTSIEYPTDRLKAFVADPTRMTLDDRQEIAAIAETIEKFKVALTSWAGPRAAFVATVTAEDLRLLLDA